MIIDASAPAKTAPCRVQTPQMEMEIPPAIGLEMAPRSAGCRNPPVLPARSFRIGVALDQVLC